MGLKKINVDEVLNYIHSIDPENCKAKTPDELKLKVIFSHEIDFDFKILCYCKYCKSIKIHRNGHF